MATNVLGIGLTFDDLSRVKTNTSYAGTTTNTAVVNQIQYTYDGWGNVIKSQQTHGGAVMSGTNTVSGTNIGTVQYTFDDGIAASNSASLYLRPTVTTYPRRADDDVRIWIGDEHGWEFGGQQLLPEPYEQCKRQHQRHEQHGGVYLCGF